MIITKSRSATTGGDSSERAVDVARNANHPREEAAMRAAIVCLITAPLALAALPAVAQSNPSSDQIIQSLKPSGNLLSGGTRGIRMANPNATEATPQASSSPSSDSQPAGSSQPAPQASTPRPAAPNAT